MLFFIFILFYVLFFIFSDSITFWLTFARYQRLHSIVSVVEWVENTVEYLSEKKSGHETIGKSFHAQNSQCAIWKHETLKLFHGK